MIRLNGVNMNKFKVNQQLSSRSTCNHECVFIETVISRTDKTITITQENDTLKRCKIHLDDQGNELIYPYGRYSMCTVFRA